MIHRDALCIRLSQTLERLSVQIKADRCLKSAILCMSCSEVSALEFSGAYFQVSAYSIGLQPSSTLIRDHFSSPILGLPELAFPWHFEWVCMMRGEDVLLMMHVVFLMYILIYVDICIPPFQLLKGPQSGSQLAMILPASLSLPAEEDDGYL